jgi:hypothetical protein
MAEESQFSLMGLDSNEACKWLRLKHQVYGTELKNLVERLIHQQIKDRTDECFDDHFSCR